MKKTLDYLQQKKLQQQKITALTCYDYPTAILEDRAGIDIIFVGDSVGTNILGYEDETQVTMDDIVHHLKAVHRGVKESCILADLPYKSYETPQQALDNARHLVKNGADFVKLEGLQQDVIECLIEQDIKVCGHLGLTPQTQSQKAVQGKTFAQAQEIITNAIKLERLGIILLVLELVPEELGQITTSKLNIPTIGIGSGRFTDGQVLIVNDILGITPRKLRLAIKYQDYQNLTLETIEKYQKDVQEGNFPSLDNLRNMPKEELVQVQQWIEKK